MFILVGPFVGGVIQCYSHHAVGEHDCSISMWSANGAKEELTFVMISCFY